MEFETWWLVLIPVLFSLGWLAARLDRRSDESTQERVPTSYFKGVNFLLSEQPDKAIDAFLEVASIDTHTVELHFALANLFRKKGEVDRAIRVHQFLSTREQIKQSERERATYELGVDFLRAGILDRAEKAFFSLAATDLKADAARQLLELYELEKAWDKAIEQAEKLREFGAPIPSGDIAHFYCEQAQQAIEAGQFDDARRGLQNALLSEPKNVRASLLLGEIYFLQDRFEEAIAQWRSAEKQNPWYLPLVGPKMWEAFKRLNRMDEGIAALQTYCSMYPSIDLLLVLAKAIEEAKGPAAAFVLLRDQVRARPSLLGLDKLLEHQLRDMTDDERSQDLRLTRELISKHTQRLERYRCQHCGFQAKKFYWQCPGCAHWDSIVPRRAEELDFYPVPLKKTA
ncbi:MAG TPA: lipopolysaccharide assembly protein LapB [Limnobacter sp.]|uniref:lipopolysaccharide assembly protein LapB n=1 Tax=Limnobacter sp. TaxID=2003368 RepID=UPI002ED9C845